MSHVGGSKNSPAEFSESLLFIDILPLDLSSSERLAKQTRQGLRLEETLAEEHIDVSRDEFRAFRRRIYEELAWCK